MAADVMNLPDFDVDSIDSVEIPCDLQIALMYKNQITPARQCDNPARWSGQYPCCGKFALVCERHQCDKNPYWCSGCKKHHPDLIHWTRL